MWNDGSDGGMMTGGWDMMGGFGVIFWLVILAIIIAGVVWFVRSQTNNRQPSVGRRSPGLEVLEERYARGEISREDYLQKRRDIID